MPQEIIPLVFVLIVLVAWFIITYNRFIENRNKIEEAWSGIDVALKRRFNLIPNTATTIFGLPFIPDLQCPVSVGPLKSLFIFTR